MDLTLDFTNSNNNKRKKFICSLLRLFPLNVFFCNEVKQWIKSKSLQISIVIILLPAISSLSLDSYPGGYVWLFSKPDLKLFCFSSAIILFLPCLHNILYYNAAEKLFFFHKTWFSSVFFFCKFHGCWISCA